MKLKTILFFVALILSFISLDNKEQNICINNYNQEELLLGVVPSNDCGYYLHIQGKNDQEDYIMNNLYISDYYIKNHSYSNILNNQISIYNPIKTKGLLVVITNMIQNIYLYHSINKLGRT